MKEIPTDVLLDELKDNYNIDTSSEIGNSPWRYITIILVCNIVLIAAIMAICHVRTRGRKSPPPPLVLKDYPFETAPEDNVITLLPSGDPSASYRKGSEEVQLKFK